MDEEMNCFALECSNCHASKDLPMNISIVRLNDEVREFLKAHEGQPCKAENLYIATFKL